MAKPSVGELMSLNLSQAIYRIISDLDNIHLDDEKKSVGSSIIMQIKKSDSFNNKYLDVIENRIVGFIDKIRDEDKINLYSETETGIINSIDIETVVISQIELNLQMELLDEVTKELFEYAECS